MSLANNLALKKWRTERRWREAGWTLGPENLYVLSSGPKPYTRPSLSGCRSQAIAHADERCRA